MKHAVANPRWPRLGWIEGTAIGAAQILALLPGISRSGSIIVAGLIRSLTREDAARFAFLLATPAIAGAGVFKPPELAGPTGHGILGQVLAGSLVAVVLRAAAAPLLAAGQGELDLGWELTRPPRPVWWSIAGHVITNGTPVGTL